MVSNEHPKSKYYIRSIPALRQEESYHLLNHYSTIHPLSKFYLYRQFLMFFVLSGIYAVLPFMLLFITTHRPYIFVGVSVLQVLFMTEMIMTLFTGYFQGDRIILNRKKIFFQYLKTYMIFDLISIIPFFVKQFWFINKSAVLIDHWRKFFICENFKIRRYKYWFNCYRLMMEYYEVPKRISLGFGFMLRFSFVMNIGFSLRQCLRHVDSTVAFKALRNQFFNDFYDMSVRLLGVAYGQGRTNTNYKENLIAVFYVCAGFCFVVVVMCVFWQHLTKSFATGFSETVTYGQYNVYASYAGLSSELQQRINTYLEFKYQREFYKEHIIKSILSGELIKETKATVSKSRLEKVKLFSAVPDELKFRLEEHLLTDIFLPGDIIIKAGTKGNYLYFIVSGTVTVTSAAGEHICCLEDGANFGEIALILNQVRTTTIIAATPCELLLLRRADYESILNPYPEVKKDLKKEALERLHDTAEHIAEGPVCHLFDPGRATRSKPNPVEDHTQEEKEEFVEAISTRSTLHAIEKRKSTT